LVPGLGASDVSLLPLRRFLRDRGHHARSAGLGRIGGDVESQSALLLERVRDVATARSDTVALVGWSLGGILSRVVARDAPELVRCVVTFGTPVTGPAATAVRRRYSDAELDHIESMIERRRAAPLATPITAIWSRRDGIVPPAAAIDRWSASVEHVEVGSPHLGLGIDPDVWQVVAERLAR
jgi:pimeloyl-ACP methyl ester carboxylesterase